MPLSLGISSGAGTLKNPAEANALGYRVNYITNPSFEVDLTKWDAVNSSLARVTSENVNGSACLQVTNASAGGAQFGGSSKIPLLGSSSTYYLSAYVKLDTGATPANYYLRYLQYENANSTSTVSAGNIGLQALSVTGSWVRLSGSFTKAFNANFAIIRVGTSSTTNGDIFFVDSVLLEDSSSLGTYFDGSSGGFWTGTAHASFSGATPY
jgi:hypothetical protein